MSQKMKINIHFHIFLIQKLFVLIHFKQIPTTFSDNDFTALFNSKFERKSLLARQRANLRNRPKIRLHPGFIQFNLMVEVFINIEHKIKYK